MELFNYDEYNNLVDNRDYLGAANYLSKFKPSTPQDQIKANRLINQLKREGEIRAAYLSKMDDKQRDAYDFFSATQGKGIIPHTQYNNRGEAIENTSNIYGDKWNEYINGLKAANGNSIEKLKYTFADDSSIANLYKQLGVNDITAKQKYNIDIAKDFKTGKYTLTMDKRNPSLAIIINSLDVQNNEDNKNKYEYSTSPNTLNPIFKNKGRTYTVEGIDAKGNVYHENTWSWKQGDKNSFNSQNIAYAVGIYNDAKNTQEQALDAVEPKDTLYNTTISPFLGAGQANAYKRMQQGLISLDDYNKIVEERTNTYNILLKQAGLTQYDVYATEIGNKKKGAVLEQVDNVEKNQLEKLLLVGMDEKRVTYSAAIVAGRTGTYITIAPKADNKGNYVEGDAAKPVRLFVPGLFQSSCDETFERDTKTAAMRDMADIQRYQYAKLLHDGTSVGYSKDSGFYKIISTKGKTIKIPIDENEMLASLNRQNIIDKSAEQLLNTIGSDGKPLNHNVNGVEVPYDIPALGKLLASAGVQELYEDQDVDKGTKLQEENNIYNNIMQILNNFYYNSNNN